jgi:hypothetical protein
MDDLASKIKELRLKRRMSQEDLAKAAGISQPLVVKLESGRQPHTTKLSAIARALHVSAADLDPNYYNAPVEPPVPVAQGSFDGASFSHALWFANFINGRDEEEISRIKSVLKAAFPR